MQDEITEAVTIAIAPAIADAEQQRALRKRPESLDAWAAFQRGAWHLGKFTANDNLVAQRFFQQAIDVDPTFTGGYSGLAEAQLYAVITFGTRSLLDVQKPVEALARQAVALDSADPEARLGLGITMLMSGDFGGAESEIEQALAISPNSAIAHGARGLTLIYSGRPKEELAAIQESIRLDPRDPTRVMLLQNVESGSTSVANTKPQPRRRTGRFG